MSRLLAAFAFTALVALSLIAQAQNVKVEEVVGNLSNPCGVAVQPGTNQVYITDSARGRVQQRRF